MDLTREQREDFVKMTVDGLVQETGMPAVGFAMIDAGLIDKAGLKRMVRAGKLEMVRVTAGKGHVNAFYSTDCVPELLRQLEEEGDMIHAVGHEELDDSESGDGFDDPSEELPGGLRATEDAEEERDGGYKEAREQYEKTYGEPYDIQDNDTEVHGDQDQE